MERWEKFNTKKPEVRVVRKEIKQGKGKPTKETNRTPTATFKTTVWKPMLICRRKKDTGFPRGRRNG